MTQIVSTMVVGGLLVMGVGIGMASVPLALSVVGGIVFVAGVMLAIRRAGQPPPESEKA
jgi:hypothetical protein